ncbi:protein FAM204A [Diretmus argenteus]
MYSGLLPEGLTEADLSSDEEDSRDVEEREDRSESSSEKLSDVGGNSVSVVEVDSSSTPSDRATESPSCSLPGISQEMWQKFHELKQKKDEIKTMKVHKARTQQRKGNKNVIYVHRETHLRTMTMSSDQRNTKALLRVARPTGRQVEHEKHWDGLKLYFGVNDRFRPPACSESSPKSGLEKSIESAIAEGDIAKAEEMSDRLATRELAVKIAEAADCRDFVQRKQEEEASRAAQKRKKQIAWGFEAKRRWETKSNMGFM